MTGTEAMARARTKLEELESPANMGVYGGEAKTLRFLISEAEAAQRCRDLIADNPVLVGVDALRDALDGTGTQAQGT